jgi:hypothetical protein
MKTHRHHDVFLTRIKNMNVPHEKLMQMILFADAADNYGDTVPQSRRLRQLVT